MSAKELKRLIDAMDPEEALAELAAAVNRLYPLLGEKARSDFLVRLLGAAGGDKVSSMVHL